MKALDYDGLDHVVDKIYDLINSGGSADYIVEEGTSGIWTYRKWASGVMEAYGRESRSTAMTNKIQEYSYYGNQSFTISALGFTDIKSIQVTGQASGHYFGTKVEAFSTSTIQASSRASGSVTSTIDFMIDIKGLWKEFTPSSTGSTYSPIDLQALKELVDTISGNIGNLKIVKTQDIADINAGYNVNDAPRIMWYYTGGTAQFYISFDFYWIRLQFRSNAAYMDARVIYGNSVGGWTRI